MHTGYQLVVEKSLLSKYAVSQSDPTLPWHVSKHQDDYSENISFLHNRILLISWWHYCNCCLWFNVGTFIQAGKALVLTIFINPTGIFTRPKPSRLSPWFHNKEKKPTVQMLSEEYFSVKSWTTFGIHDWKKARLFGIFVFIIKSEGRFYVAAIMPPYLVYYWL